MYFLRFHFVNVSYWNAAWILFFALCFRSDSALCWRSKRLESFKRLYGFTISQLCAYACVRKRMRESENNKESILTTIAHDISWILMHVLVEYSGTFENSLWLNANTCFAIEVSRVCATQPIQWRICVKANNNTK